MIKSNKEVTRKFRETYFLHRKPQKLKIAKKILFVENCFRKKGKNLLAKSHSAENTKTGQLSQNTKINVFPSKLGKDESKLSFLRIS